LSEYWSKVLDHKTVEIADDTVVETGVGAGAGLDVELEVNSFDLDYCNKLHLPGEVKDG
jgi:hypothetical protein